MEAERLGWEAWLVTHVVDNRTWFPFPPDRRILLGRRPPLRRRLANRALLRPGHVRRGERLLPGISSARATLVHAHFGWSGAEALPAARRLGLPLLVSFHGTDINVYPHTERGRREYAELFERVDRVTVVSELLAGKLRALGYDGPLDVVHMGVPVAEIPFRPAPPPAPPTRLLFVGRQVACKGLDVLLRAFASVRRRHTGLVLDVIGDGPLRGGSEALARELGIARQVTFHGAQSKAQVLKAMSRGHVLAMPSLTPPSGEAEGSPMVTKEALAVGLQVIATDTGGTPETIPPQLRDEIVPQNDARALAAGIESLLERRLDWEGRAQLGREWIEAQFDSQQLARRMASIYEEVTGPDGA